MHKISRGNDEGHRKEPYLLQHDGCTCLHATYFNQRDHLLSSFWTISYFSLPCLKQGSFNAHFLLLYTSSSSFTDM